MLWTVQAEGYMYCGSHSTTPSPWSPIPCILTSINRIAGNTSIPYVKNTPYFCHTVKSNCYGLSQCVAHRLLLVCSAGALLWCSALVVKPAKGEVGQGDQVISVTLVTSSTDYLGLLLALACWWLLRYFWNFTETYFDQLSLKNNKDNKHIITHDIAIPSQMVTLLSTTNINTQ